MDAFAGSDASVGLVLGGAVTLAFTFVYYMMRDVLTFQEFTECIPEGFKSMIAPIMILTLAWTLSGMTNLLGAKIFVADLVDHCSPISDTTIMASAGGHCEHVNHVATQIPYVAVVAAVCMVGYFLIGVLQAVGLPQLSLLALPVCTVLLVSILFVIRSRNGGKEEI